MGRAKIFILEDEADIQEILAYNLRKEGYHVACAKDGEVGLRRVRKERPDLLLLDLMLPGLDGIEVCRRLKSDRETRALPVIMLTAKGEESDIVLGLGVGADDYVTKPFSPKELLARVRAVLRRGPVREEREQRERIVLEALVIDAGRHEVLVEGRSVECTASEFRLLHFLAAHPGRVFTRDRLLNMIAGEDAFVIDRNVDVHIRAIRRKLGAHRELIETIRGVGYRFKDPVE